MRRSKLKRFTLIELMVVMVVMGFLVTLALPSFNRMISGNKVDQLASQLKLAMEQAQSRAITNRRHVALILPSNQGAGSNASQWQWLSPNLRHGGYRMAFVDYRARKIVDPDNPNRFLYQGKKLYFSGWFPGSEWQPTVPGTKLIKIVGHNATSDYESISVGTGLNSEKTISDIEWVWGGNTHRLETIYDLEYIDSSGNVQQLDLDDCAIVFSPYGGLVKTSGDIENLRLAVSEAIESGNDLIFPNRNSSGQTIDFRALEVNRFTGNVKYYNNDN